MASSKVVVGAAEAVGVVPVQETPAASKQESQTSFKFVCSSSSEPAIVPGLYGKSLLWPGIEYTTVDSSVAEKLRADARLKEIK